MASKPTTNHRYERPVNFATSPLLASKTPLWRSKLLLVAFGLAFVGLGARAAYVQVIHQNFYQKQGEMRFARTLDVPATRGRLLDRNNQVLAANVPALSVWAIPDDVNASLQGHPEKLSDLSHLLGMSVSELQQKLGQEDRSFVWLKRRLDNDLSKSIQALQIEGLYTRTEPKRQYPEGEAAAQLTGSINNDGKGIEGLELTFNSDLSGKSGSRRVIKDRMGRVVEDIGDQVLASDGHDVHLTIDNKIQFFAYQKLKEAVLDQHAKSGSAVVLDAQTNEVLALANFDTDKSSGLRNRALSDSFEPGSVMKPLTVSLALERKLVTPHTIIQTAPGSIIVQGAKISDAEAHEGLLSVERIIQMSSNVGTVKIALQMPAQAMWDFYSQVGLGQKPALPFPGIVGGKLRNFKTWRPIEQATMSYGYGLSVSLFQLAEAYGVLARGGEVIPPRLIQNSKADEVSAEPVQRVMSAETAGEMRHMLQMVTSEGGTAPQAQTEGYTVGGKTGTAYKHEGRGYDTRKYRSTFVGIAPIDHPRIVVAVSIDEPSNGHHFGGEVAGPVFSKTVGETLRILGVAPDRSVKPQIAIKATPENT